MARRPVSRPKPQTSLSLSRELRWRLDVAATASGRSRSAEVEARLRASLDAPAGGGLLLLRIDGGLEDWLQATSRGWIFGDVEQTAIHLVRNALHEQMNGDVCFAAIVPHLSPDRREHLMRTPKWQALGKGR